MKTTAIFAEVLVIGLQAVVWLSLFALSFSGVSWVARDALAELPDWTPLIAVFAIAFAYPLGIIVDRMADSIFHPLDLRIRAKVLRGSKPRPARMRLYILAKNEGVALFLDYIRSRLRIARSTSLNLVLLTLSAAVFLTTRNLTGELEVIPLVASGVMLGLASLFAWYRISRTYYKRLRQAYEISQGEDRQTAARERSPRRGP